MKVVVDTNVLISAAFRDRLPEDVIMFLVSHPEFQWIATQDIVREYLDVLKRKKFSLTESIIRKWEQMIEDVIHIVPDSIVIEFPRDQKDAVTDFCLKQIAFQIPVENAGGELSNSRTDLRSTHRRLHCR